MIAPLRRRHRRVTAVLTLAVPVLYAVALAGRVPEPRALGLPAALAGETPAGEVVQEYGALFTGQAITARLGGAGSAWWIELEPREPVTLPEVLVYWAPRAPRESDPLPPNAFLLGAVAGRRARAFALPDGTLGRAGRLVLYSLGHREIVASAPLPAVGEAPALDQGAPSEEAQAGDETAEAAP